MNHTMSLVANWIYFDFCNQVLFRYSKQTPFDSREEQEKRREQRRKKLLKKQQRLKVNVIFVHVELLECACILRCLGIP